MSAYELTILFNDEKDIKEVKQLLENVKAKIVNEKNWGTRQLSYPINKLTSALYLTMQIEMEGNQVSELKKRLNFNEKLVRYLLLQKED